MNNIKCHICNTEMEAKETSISAGWGKYKVDISGVTGYVCPNCGEVIYSSEEAKMILKLGQEMSALNNPPDLLNISEVADLLRVSQQTIYNKIRDGSLKARKIGREWRFFRKDIQAYLDEPSFGNALLAARNSGDAITQKDQEVIKREMEDM
jgi:excisionase family DNA binding protein/YgiT-type zinc finger domain-containing protein